MREHKIYCDACSRDIDFDGASTLRIVESYDETKYFDLCSECLKKIKKLIEMGFKA